MVRGIPPGNHHPVIIGHGDLVGRGIDRDRQPGFAVIGIGTARTDHGHLGSGLFEPVVGIPELEFVVEGLYQNKHSLAVEFHRCTSLWGFGGSIAG